MTTEEAVNELLGLKDSLDGLPPETGVIETFDVLNMAIKALEEIQQYREIGTVADIKKAVNVLKETLHELYKYRKIGTVEECRTAIEKQKAKKIEYEGFFSQDGFAHYRMGKCPNCDRWYRNTDDIMYCSGCGVRLDWSEEE